MEQEEKYAVIISPASDCNRGDQALLWQACKMIQETLKISHIFVLNSISEDLHQSTEYGFVEIDPILEHPSHRESNNHSIRYSMSQLIRWGIRACGDYIQSTLLSTQFCGIVEKTLSESQSKSYHILKHADIVVIKGGGFLHTYGSISDPYYIYFQLYHLKLAQYLGRKTLIFPNSFGPFRGPGVKKQVRKALGSTDLVMTRETLSTDSLKQIGVDGVRQYPDMAFGLEKLESAQLIAIVKKYGLQSKSRNVAITVRPYRFPEFSHKARLYDAYQKAIACFADWLEDNNYHPWFIEHTYSSNPHENDSLCIQSVIDIMKHKPCYIKERELNCREMKALYSYFDYMIGTRFHSVIFSLSELVPSLAVSYSGNKAKGIMEDIGLDDYTLDASTLTADELKIKFQKLIANKDEYLQKVEAYLRYANTQDEKMKKLLIETFVVKANEESVSNFKKRMGQQY